MPDLVVVLDVNIYVRAACHFRRTGTFPRVATIYRDPDEASLAVVAALANVSGRSSGVRQALLFTSDALDDLVLRKLTQDSTATVDEDRGEGWDEAALGAYLDPLYAALDCTGRSYSVAAPPPYAASGVDYEDARIWGLFRYAMSEEPTRYPVLVTLDRSFAYRVNAEAPLHQSPPLWSAEGPSVFLSRP